MGWLLSIGTSHWVSPGYQESKSNGDDKNKLDNNDNNSCKCNSGNYYNGCNGGNSGSTKGGQHSLNTDIPEYKEISEYMHYN